MKEAEAPVSTMAVTGKPLMKAGTVKWPAEDAEAKAEDDAVRLRETMDGISEVTKASPTRAVEGAV